jgi:hypothetical protein
MQYTRAVRAILVALLSSGVAVACTAPRSPAPTPRAQLAKQPEPLLPKVERDVSPGSTAFFDVDAGGPQAIEASTALATECRDIETDPEWFAIQGLVGSRLATDAALCACWFPGQGDIAPTALPSARRANELTWRFCNNKIVACDLATRAGGFDARKIAIAKADLRDVLDFSVSDPQIAAGAFAFLK